ncbi:MAG: cobyrinate a,c-diamide synthase [Oscillospiraceae bacterium]|nr:cobyrinate a,c-diamide synthase [Oscillospiraceae bacterium]
MLRPRFVLAAPASGSGKTMITCGLLQALRAREMRVSSFKCGPDYIDPMFHEKVLGTKSANLDLFFAGKETLRRLFLRDSEGTDVSVIEGVMGFYDGLSAASDEASTYDVARTLDAPVVLIVNARGQSLSAIAALQGFLRFKPDSGICGVIFNQMSPHVFEALRPEVAALGVQPLGYVPKASELVVESRHLGLVTPDEIADLNERLSRLAALLEDTVDIDALLALARSAPELEAAPRAPLPKLEGVRVAVAKDEAFCFLYRDNLALLEELGAELLYFSPIHDKGIPAGAQGLLLCGGYPELYAEQLAANESMRREISAAIREGMPCMAECGGFLYLHRELEDMSGRYHPMAGVLDTKAWRTNKLGRFGYITLTAQENCGLLRGGEPIRAHEFHYYESGNCGDAMQAVKPVTGKSWRCMHAGETLLAGFPHLFYESDPQLPLRFLQRCAGKE